MKPPQFESSLENLIALTADLRSPEGCPWDREQNHLSVVPHLLEETYEVVEALESQNDSSIREELGDLLFQITFHAQLAKERGSFDFEDIAKAVFDKLVYRHPHVYGEKQKTLTGKDVLLQWDELKAKEKTKTKETSILDSVPRTLPAIQRSEKIQSKVAKQGFDWPTVLGVFEKFQEEIKELETELKEYGSLSERKLPYRDAVEDELGDLFFLLVNLSRKLSIDPETCLRRANQKFETRFRMLEEIVKNRNKTLEEHSLFELETIWTEVKAQLKSKEPDANGSN